MDGDDGQPLAYLIAFRPARPLRCVGIIGWRRHEAIIDDIDDARLRATAARGAVDR